MKRSDILKAAPLGLAALAGGSGILLPKRGIAQVTPTPSPTPAPCAKWDFPAHGPNHDGSGGYMLANYRTDCGLYATVGGITMDFLYGKGGQLIKDNIVFYLGADPNPQGPNACSFQLSDLPAIYGGNKLVQYFKQWYAQMNGDGSQIDVFNGSQRVAHGITAPKLQTTTVQMYPDMLNNAGYPLWVHDWGNTWKGNGLGPDISGECAFALGAETIGILAVIGAAVGGIAGPVEWTAFAAAVVLLTMAMRDVIILCGK